MPPIAPKSPGRKRVLWLQTQPEHYFNRMMDDLARRSPEIEYVAAFSWPGPGWYEDNAPAVAPWLTLTPRAGVKGPPTMSGGFHADWRRELFSLEIDAAVVSGYGYRTHWKFIGECARRGIPLAMFSDSNIRSQRGHTLRLRLKRRLKRFLLHKLISQSQFLLTANTRGLAYWRYFGAPREKLVLCPYYGDYPRARAAAAKPRGEVLARHGLPPEARYIFTAARLVPAKGLDLALLAFQAHQRQDPNWHYLIAGVGPEERALRALAGDALGKSVHFLGFQQPTDNLALMAHADLHVLPSRYEPHGIVVAEAACVGTPTLASDVCGAAAALVRPRISGEIFRSGDLADLTLKLHHLLADREHLRALRGGATATFEEWFARTNPVVVTDRIARQMLNLPAADATSAPGVFS